MFRRIVATLILILVLSTCISTIEVNAEANLTTKLKENLIPLKTTQAENGFEDLMPLKEILKDKKIIGMGEATHGTAEFFQMKHRMFEFLVEEMGYRVFAIEAEFGGSQIVNDYILYGKGSIGESLEAMKFWTWNTQEVADMIQWMKEYNEKPENKNKIRFYGYDMQSIDNDKIYIRDYLEKINSPSKDNFKNPNLNLEDIQNDLVENKEVYIEKSSPEEYDLILQHIVLINQWDDFHNKKSEFDVRDYYMAENVKWILDYETKYYGNDKIMLWAHNGHISKSYHNFKSMGTNLKDMYNEDYYAMGFDFYEGSFIAKPATVYGKMLGKLSKFHINSSPTGSYSDEMRKTNIPISFLDIENDDQDKLLLEFLSSKLHVNNIGATYFGKFHNVNPMNKTVLKDSFDGMIFVESTEEAKRTDNYIDKVSDGKNVLISYYTFMIILLGIIYIFSHTLYKRKFKSNLGELSSDKFYILGRDTEENVDISSAKKFIIEVNNYFNSISSIKYFLISSSSIIIIVISMIIINSLYISKSVLFDIGTWSIFELVIYILIGTVETLLPYILLLNILKIISNNKSIKLDHILIISIIVTIFTTKNYLNAGILIYCVNLLLAFIYGFIYCYTYGLFYYKKKKPLIIITIISIIEDIITIVGITLLSKI